MSYDLRTITFAADLLIKPRAHQHKDLQKVHEAAFDSEKCSYKNFAVIPGGAQISNPLAQPGAISAATILPDRMRVQEQGTGTIREDFEARLQALSEIVMEHLKLKRFRAQQFVVQSLINPRSCTDARDYLAGSIFNLEEDSFSPFGRRPELLGTRFVFPPTAENPGLYNIRIESYGQDTRSLFIENVGVFNSPLGPESTAEIATRFGHTYHFVKNSVLQFVARFEGS